MKLPVLTVAKVALLSSLAAFSAPRATSVEDQALTVTVAIGTLESSPLQIDGIRLSEQVGDPPRVLLRNTSSKTTKKIWVEALIGSAGAGFISTNSNGPNESWPQERVIAAGASAEVRETALQSNNLVMAAGQLHSRCLKVSVLVLRVEFSDGSAWMVRTEQEKQIWKNMIWPHNASTSEPHASDCRLEELDGVGYRPTAPRPARAEVPVSSYSFSCALRPSGSKTIAMCRNTFDWAEELPASRYSNPPQP